MVNNVYVVGQVCRKREFCGRFSGSIRTNYESSSLQFVATESICGVNTAGEIYTFNRNDQPEDKRNARKYCTLKFQMKLARKNNIEYYGCSGIPLKADSLPSV